MTWILYCLIILLVGSFYRLIRGPFIEDRISALNVAAVIIVLVISLYAISYRQSFYLDIALIYAILSFGEVLAFVKFSSNGASTEKD